MNEFLESTKVFLRVDGNDNDEILTTLIESAIAYVVTTTGRSLDLEDPLARMAVNLLVRYWFDNHEQDVPHGIKSMITQLAYRPEKQ